MSTEWYSVSVHDCVSVLLPAQDGAGVEEGDGSNEEPVGDVRQEDGERLLVVTAALAAGQRGQQGPQVRGLAEDGPVDGDGDALAAVEGEVGPPLLCHVLAHTGDQALSVPLPSLQHHRGACRCHN